jgi:hypothetical protein
VQSNPKESNKRDVKKRSLEWKKRENIIHRQLSGRLDSNKPQYSMNCDCELCKGDGRIDNLRTRGKESAAEAELDRTKEEENTVLANVEGHGEKVKDHAREEFHSGSVDLVLARTRIEAGLEDNYNDISLEKRIRNSKEFC